MKTRCIWPTITVVKINRSLPKSTNRFEVILSLILCLGFTAVVSAAGESTGVQNTNSISEFHAATEFLKGGSLDRSPSLAELIPLRKEDRAALIDSFRVSEITNKVRVAWALAYIDGPEILDTLREPLEADYHGRKITGEEVQAFLEILRTIGYLGQTSDAAYKYLTQSLSTEVWRERIKWNAGEAVDDPPLRLCGFTAMSVALSGRPDAMRHISKFIIENNDKIGYVSGEVVESIFYLWYINEHGKSRLAKGFLKEAEVYQEFVAFYKTDLGKAWQNWYYRKVGIKKPAE